MPGGSSSNAADDAPTWRRFLRRVPGRVAAHWRLKAVLTATLGVLFTSAYLLIGHFPIAPVRHLPLTWIDRAIAFHPYEWVWIYQSLYIPINVIPWLAERREELWRYVRGFALLSLVSFAIFIAWPIRMPRPHVEDPRGMYWLLLQYDAPHNSLPSLHAGLLIYTLAFGRRIIGHETPRGLKLICVVWAALILYATLATKEHYLADIVTGAALAVAVDGWVWRRRLTEDPQQERADVPRGIEVMVGAADGV